MPHDLPANWETTALAEIDAIDTPAAWVAFVTHNCWRLGKLDIANRIVGIRVRRALANCGELLWPGAWSTPPALARDEARFGAGT